MQIQAALNVAVQGDLDQRIVGIFYAIRAAIDGGARQ